MSGFLDELQAGIGANLTLWEGAILALLAFLAWRKRKEIPLLPVLYSVFLILHITLLRRRPGYHEGVRLHFLLWPGMGLMVGNLLNIILYLPLGWAAAQWLHRRRNSTAWAVLTGAVLSAFCEWVQYVTGRGMADVNDVAFNTLGAAAGVFFFWVGYKNAGQ